MITAQSPGPSIVALITCTWPSLTAAACTPRRKNLCCASCATMPELPTPWNSMRWPPRPASASSAIACSTAPAAAALRYFSSALTALSITLTTMSPALSSSSTARCTKGTPSLTLPASLSLKSARPS